MSLRIAASASLLSLIVPGAGHLYLGRARRFLLPAAGFLLTAAVLAVTSSLGTPLGFSIYLFGITVLPILSLIDSFVIGLHAGRVARPWYSRWYAVIAWMIALCVSVALAISARESLLGYGVFRMPNSIMAPALLAHDIVLVDTRAPGQGRLAAGAVVVVRHPGNHALYLRRIDTMLSGTTVNLRSGGIYRPAYDADFQDIPVAAIEGVVTSVLWSPERRIVLGNP